MRSATTASAVIALALLLPATSTVAQVPSPIVTAGPSAAGPLHLIPVEAGGLALREQAMTFSGEELREQLRRRRAGAA